jgi:hypothetical protein
MELVLDDIVRVLEWLMLGGEWIGRMKELIDSILHDYDWVGHGRVRPASGGYCTLNLALSTCTAPPCNRNLLISPNNSQQHYTTHPSRALSPLLFHPRQKWRQSCTFITLSLFSLSFFSHTQRKNLKVADLKEICSRANIPTTTRLTKADLITKILASQPAIDAYNVKYSQNGNSAPSSRPPAPSTNDDIVSRNAHLSTRRTYSP